MLDKELDGLEDDKAKRARRRGIYLLPNLLTSGTLFGGFYSIIACFDGKFEIAAVAIIISGFIDALDGRVARLTNTTSRFGGEYDSLADMVAFGLAPGILIFTWALRDFGRYGWLAAFLFVVCGALRLARFNVQITSIEKKHFKGLPTPLAAGLVATTVLMFFYLGEEQISKHITVLVLIYLLAFLMVSNVKYYSFKEFNLSQRMPFRFLIALILLFLLIAAEPPIVLFTLAAGYVASGPVAALVVFARRRLGPEKKDAPKAADGTFK